MNCIIIDDDAAARLIVQQMCKNNKLNVQEEFSSAIEAIKYLNSFEVDLIFLDIHMPTFSGFDFIRSLKNPPKIILTTSDKEFALKAFEYDCIVDYLLKPITIDRFKKSLEKLLKPVNDKKSSTNIKDTNIKENANYIYVNVEKRLVKIDIPKILLVEAKGDYINIKTEKKNYIVHSTLKKIEEKLPSKLFLRIHRSFIINTTEIIDIEDNTVLIQKHVIPISRSNKPELIRRLNLL
ncbi:LytTR family DNA-binding domain-containing protein [uncultured Polaribacter sp.]|uniref:LytR/AlgR family response regulator transcription factor n=1 Tax=uncultured Polaribacter sp. TaxID=174711 RepID=UPI002626B130|nr:LytTR family DNA-binding domain-containing protein [uncultured Polaribacter sp.]